jgi:hypothetical protein
MAALRGVPAAFRKPLNPARQGPPRLAQRSKPIETNEVFAYAGLTFWRFSMRTGSRLAEPARYALACSRPRKCIAATSPMTSSVPTSPATPFHP